VEYVAPQATASVTAIYEAQNWSTTVTGTNNDYFAASQLELAAGRIFSEAEETAGKSVCVIGETVRSSLFRDDEAIGRNIRLNDISCQVIGLLTKRGQSGFGLDPDDQVIMPIKTVMRRLTGNQDVRAFQVAVDPEYDSTAVSAAIIKLLRERRNLTSGIEDDFNIFDSKQLADTLSGTTRTLTLLLGAVAAVSLIVGGVGIMNIMLVSVTERTHEIGIRLAIGAVQREVLMQFLVEAVVLSCLGGIIGLILALAATIGLSSLFGLPFIFNVEINLLAFAFAALIGVVFGYFPARRAASLNPIDALRHE
jgi:putative ABC transport system permease protein